MNFRRFFTILISTTALIQNIGGQTKIEGHLIIDTAIWSRVVYLSLISHFDQMNTMAVEMIIDKSPIDKSGYFSFSTQYLPKDDHLYRIHIPRKNDPPASLTIGGNYENHLFFIANRESGVLIKDTSSLDLFKSITIDGYYANKEFLEINQLASYIDSTVFAGSPIKTDLIRNAINEKLRFYADTCSIPLVALYALYKSQFEFNYPINQPYYNKLLSKWKDEKSTYFIDFRKKIPSSSNGNILIYIVLCTFFFILGFALRQGIHKYKEIDKNIIKNLTNQERRILLLIKAGKSNKEISDELSIELSTVKSHAYNIFSKLGINSRKEILNLDLNKDLDMNNE
jgi:DNA-binding CsgD family transcriptional regulator